MAKKRHDENRKKEPKGGEDTTHRAPRAPEADGTGEAEFLMRHQPFLLYPALKQLSMDALKRFFY